MIEPEVSRARGARDGHGGTPTTTAETAAGRSPSTGPTSRLPSRITAAIGPLHAVAAVIALVPAVRMLMWVLDGDPVQFADYWLIFDALFEEDGSLHFGDIFEPYNGHVMALPKLVYWANIELFAGSNVALGLYVVIVALVQVGLLWALVPRGRDVHPLGTGAVLVAVGALVFAPHGAWSFLRSMSGTAWLTANTFAVAAVMVRSRGRRHESHALALLAALSYGTGLSAFAGVIVVAAAAERRIPWRDWPAAALGAAMVLWYRAADVNPSPSPAGGDKGFPAVANGALRLVGTLGPAPRSLAAWVGALVLVLAVGAAAWVSIRPRGAVAAGWTGLLAYGVGCVLAIAWGRHFLTDFRDSRYSSIAVMVWLPVMAVGTMYLSSRLGRARWLAGAPVLLLAVSIGFGGTGPVARTRATHLAQTELANALRLQVAADGSPWLGLGIPMPAVRDRLVKLGHYPFSSDYHDDCGLLGEQIDPPSSNRDGEAVTFEGGVDSIETAGASVPRGVVVTGWADLQPEAVDCILLLDGDTVVGVGTFGWPRVLPGWDVADDGIRALAPLDVGELKLVVRLKGDDRLVAVPDPLGTLSAAATG